MRCAKIASFRNWCGNIHKRRGRREHSTTFAKSLPSGSMSEVFYLAWAPFISQTQFLFNLVRERRRGRLIENHFADIVADAGLGDEPGLGFGLPTVHAH